MTDLYDALRQGGFCAVPAGARGPVDGASPEFEGQRAAARRGCSIERAVIMVDRSRRHDADVREVLERDAAAGIRTLLVDAANALPVGVSAESFGIWDDEVVTNGAGAESRRDEDLRRAREAADALRGARPDPGELIVDEPLARTARLARELAPERCPESFYGDTDCTLYHGLVQYLRLLGVVAAPQRQGHFYREALAAAARAGEPLRVLVAGAADASMLAHVVTAYEGTGAALDVTVVDVCKTPLAVCEWYASTRGLAIRTARCNVADFADGAPYDVICTDSLLTLVPPDVRPAAVGRWHALLRPGGRVVTSMRIGGAGASSGGSPADDFADWVLGEAERRRDLLDVDPQTLADEARRYTGTIPLYPLASRDELVELFAGAGLALDGLQYVRLEGRGPQGPAAGNYKTAEYARVVAVR